MPVSSKAGRTSESAGSFQTHSHKIRITRVWASQSWVIASCFLAGNGEAELKPTTFSSLTFPCFLVFPLFLTPQRYSTFECCLMGLLFNNNNNIYLRYLIPVPSRPLSFHLPSNPCLGKLAGTPQRGEHDNSDSGEG